MAGLGVLVARLSQVHVEIDEARRDHDTIRSDPVRFRLGQPGHGLQDAATDHDLAGTLTTGRRVDQPGPADLEIDPWTGHDGTRVPASR